MACENFSITVPAGAYYLGDPCYFVPSELWMPLLQSSEYFDRPFGTVAGHNVYASHTQYGDGQYRGSDGQQYPVDAGLIGLVPASLVQNGPSDTPGSLVVFKKDFEFGYRDGTVFAGEISIFTGDEPEEYDDVDYGDEDE